MLPLDTPPEPGEAFPAYLLRVADLMDASVHSVYDHLGLRRAGKTLRYVHLNLPERARHDLAHELRLTGPGEISRTLVDRFAGMDLNALTGPGASDAHRTVQRDQWVWMSGTRYCPACLIAGRVWSNGWQVPWMFACERHHRLLRSSCPGCGRRPDLVVRRSTHELASTLDRCACGRRWTDVEEPDAVDGEALDLQRILTAAMADRAGTLWGDATDGHTRLGAWRAAGAVTAGTPSIGSWSRRPFLVPPDDTTVMASVIVKAAAVVTARDVVTAADALGQVLLHRRGHGEARVWDVIPRTSPLAPVARVWLRRSGRVHARLARTQRDALPLCPIAPSQVPTLADPRHLPARWEVVDRPVIEMRRALLSLAVARLAGAGTWQAAGALLGIDGDYASRLVRHTLRSLGAGAAEEVTAAAQRYAAEIARTTPTPTPVRPGDYLKSARDLSGWARVTDGDEAVPRSGVLTTALPRRAAAPPPGPRAPAGLPHAAPGAPCSPGAPAGS